MRFRATQAHKVPMRIAVISDIHANLDALQQVIRHIDGLAIDQVHCLGDIVGYGPFPNECIDLIRAKCSHVVMGNHDSGVIGKTALDLFNKPGKKAIRWSQKRLTQDNLDYLKNLPLLITTDELTLVHASLPDPGGWAYVLSMKEALSVLGACSTTICFIGHTHIPAVIGEDQSTNTFRRGGRYVINVGSVGQPRDGNPKAAFGLLDTNAWTYDSIRVDYDVQKTAEAIGEAGLPLILARRLFLGY